MAAREIWRDQGKAGARPDRKATESDIEKAAELVAAAKRREASKLDTTPKAAPKPSSEAQATADVFNDFFNRPEWRAESARRHAEQQVRRAQILAEFGSIEAVYAETTHHPAALIAGQPITCIRCHPPACETGRISPAH